MKVKTLALTCVIALSLCSCGSSSGETDSATAVIEQGEGEAADIEAAIMQGRTAAREFIDADPADTLALQAKLLDARAIQSRYVTAGKREHAEAFDTAFIHTLRAVRPEVARSIESLPASN